MKYILLILLAIVGIRVSMVKLAKSQKMILCYDAGNPYGFNSYKCELVPRGSGY